MRILVDGVGELVDELAIEQSTVVTQEHEQRRSLVEEFPEGRGRQVVAVHALAALFRCESCRLHPTVVAPMGGPGRFLLGSRDRRPGADLAAGAPPGRRRGRGSVVVDGCEFAQFVETVARFDETDRARTPPGDEALGGGSVRSETHPVE